MAIIENLWLRKSKKRLGGVVLYQAMEQTRARELATSVSNPRTASQMGQRVKWSQLVNFYRVNSNWMKYAFETKSAQQSEYNKFMQLNVSNSQVYFTKQEAAAGSTIVCPYIMTQGSIPSIEFSPQAGSWWSNIYYPVGATLTSSTTVSEFSQNLIQANPAIRQGDQLSFIRFTQMFNSDTGYPYVVVRKYEVLIDISSTELVGAYLPLDYIGVQVAGDAPSIAVIDSGNAGGFLLVLSRTQGGKTYVSSQRIITTRMETTIAQYSSDAQLALAVASYGENADAFLSTTTADQNTQAPTQLAIIGIEANDHTFTPGNYCLMHADFGANQPVRVLFNGPVGTVDPSNISLYTNKKAIVVGSAYADGTSVSGNIPAGTTISEDEYLVSIGVRFPDNLYIAQFRVPST